MRLASNFGCGFGGSSFFCGVGVSAFFSVLLLGLLVVFLQRLGDRIDLRLRLLGEGLLRLGLRLGVGGFGSAFFCSGSGFGGCDLVGGRHDLGLRRRSWRSVLRPASPSAIFSTSGFGASAFGAVVMPLVICEKSASEMMSVDRNSGGGVFSGRVANVIRPHASTPACKTADMVHPAFIGQEPCSTSVTSATRRKPAAESRPITRITVP